MTRNRYADLLRVAAICGVVYGHWLLVSVTYQQGRLSGVDAIDYIRWGRWVIFGQAAIGSAQWWEQKAIWLVPLTLVLIPVVAAVSWAERPMLRLPGGIGPVGWWSPVLLVVGIGAAAQSLATFAVEGFAPGGGLPVPALSGFAVGLLATLLTGRAPQPGGDDHRPQRLQAGDHALGDAGVPVAVQLEQEPGGGDQYQHGEDG